MRLITLLAAVAATLPYVLASPAPLDRRDFRAVAPDDLDGFFADDVSRRVEPDFDPSFVSGTSQPDNFASFFDDSIFADDAQMRAALAGDTAAAAAPVDDIFNDRAFFDPLAAALADTPSQQQERPAADDADDAVKLRAADPWLFGAAGAEGFVPSQDALGRDVARYAQYGNSASGVGVQRAASSESADSGFGAMFNMALKAAENDVAKADAPAEKKADSPLKDMEPIVRNLLMFAQPLDVAPYRKDGAKMREATPGATSSGDGSSGNGQQGDSKAIVYITVGLVCGFAVVGAAAGGYIWYKRVKNNPKNIEIQHHDDEPYHNPMVARPQPPPSDRDYAPASTGITVQASPAAPAKKKEAAPAPLGITVTTSTTGV
ncbi:hypothetical protein HDU96_000652 [Phlyctochytrium bullatum]|nr:hypothetical protein HDU96_000652 [Phlyctochytrium bullatum]